MRDDEPRVRTPGVHAESPLLPPATKEGPVHHFELQNDAEPRLLFKFNRPGTGEDWSEKISAELAQMLGLPHAQVELASFEGERGAAIVDFTKNERVALVHGNEILEFVDPAYPRQSHRAPEHTVDAVFGALKRLQVGLPAVPVPLPQRVMDAFDVFVGYLLLDAWIGNTDRHHENWGVLRMHDSASQALVLAPSFDHASSLGREVDDAARVRTGNARQPHELRSQSLRLRAPRV